MKAIVSKEVVDQCCDLCIADCAFEGVCKCDLYRYEHMREDPLVADCGDVYFVKGTGVKYIGF